MSRQLQKRRLKELNVMRTNRNIMQAIHQSFENAVTTVLLPYSANSDDFVSVDVFGHNESQNSFEASMNSRPVNRMANQTNTDIFLSKQSKNDSVVSIQVCVVVCFDCISHKFGKHETITMI